MEGEVLDDIRACLAQWRALDPTLEGEVEIGFTLGAEGLEQAEIREHDGVPIGPLTCFSAAVYDADWPVVPDGKLNVHYPVRIDEGGDSG